MKFVVAIDWCPLARAKFPDPIVCHVKARDSVKEAEPIPGAADPLFPILVSGPIVIETDRLDHEDPGTPFPEVDALEYLRLVPSCLDDKKVDLLPGPFDIAEHVVEGGQGNADVSGGRAAASGGYPGQCRSDVGPNDEVSGSIST